MWNHLRRHLCPITSSFFFLFQEYWGPDLRHADGRVSISGWWQAGDIPQHFPSQCRLFAGHVWRDFLPGSWLYQVLIGENPQVRIIFGNDFFFICMNVFYSFPLDIQYCWSGFLELRVSDLLYSKIRIENIPWLCNWLKDEVNRILWAKSIISFYLHHLKWIVTPRKRVAFTTSRTTCV